jgi:2-amino-4-hydroxy-6-hydroxymethyldihydropteridine diphosphokinase
VTTAYIGLGSNLGDRAALVAEAAGHLGFLPGVRVSALSPVYRTSPVGEDMGGEFLNAVARVETDLDPQEFLASLLALEKEMGRARLPDGKTARPIDLDLLLYGGLIIDLPAQGRLPALVLPHPRLTERLFALRPLADLCPSLIVPGFGKTVADLAGEVALRDPGQTVSPAD